jgi:putative transposase
MASVGMDELDAIRLHVQRQHASGTNRFRAMIEAQIGRSAGPRKIAGRRIAGRAESLL